MMTVSWLLAMFSATFAPAGTGKLPTSPATVIVRLASAGLAEAEAEADADAEGGAEDEPGAAGLVVVVVPTVVVPAAHATSDRLAAHAVRAAAAERYLFIV